MKSLKYLLILCFLVITSCNKDDDVGGENINPLEIKYGGTTSGNFGEIIYQDETVVLNEELKTNLVEVNQNNLTFNYSSSFSQLAVGDVLFSNETELADGGFARKIVSIEENDDNYKFITTQAKAKDVFEKVNYTKDLELDFENIRNLNGANNSNLKSNIIPNIDYTIENEKVNITLTYDFDSDVTTIEDQLKLSGFVEINNIVSPYLVFNFDAINPSNNVISFPGLTDVGIGGDISFGGKTSSEFVEDDFINADANPSLEIDRSFEIAAIPLTGLVSVTDIVIKPEMVIFATIKVDITGKVYVEFSKDFRFNYNISYQGSTTGNGWDNSFEELLDDDWSFGYAATAEIEFEATPLAVGPRIKFPQFPTQGNNKSFIGVFIYPWTQNVTASVDYNSSTQCFETEIVNQNKWKATFESKISTIFSNNNLVDIDVDLFSQSYVTDQSFSVPDFCFSNQVIPNITTTDTSDISETTAESGGNVTDDGGSNVTVRGVCWSLNPNPTIQNSTTNNGTGTGTFISSMTNLTPNTTYYVRAYATNEEGTAYGNEVSFTTLSNTGNTEAVTNPTPNNNSTNISLNGSLTFTPGANTPSDATYRLYFDTNSNPTTQIDIGSQTSYDYSSLQEATPYYWKVETIGNTGNVLATSPIWGFTTATSTGNTEAVFNPIPNNGTNNVTLSGDLSFTPGANTPPDATYKLYFDTNSNPATQIDIGFQTSYNYSNLQEATPYYWKVETLGNTGNVLATSPIWSFTTATNSGGTIVVDVTNPITGKTWMDRNLGASQAATSSTDELAYGDLYQWGRGSDGHEKRNSNTTTTLSNSDTPGHGDFILNVGGNNSDWRSPQNPNLWQGSNGINNPCPTGYRLPTITEWEEEIQSWSSNNNQGAFDSPLKLTLAGARFKNNGTIYGIGTITPTGYYWSSTVFDGIPSIASQIISFNANTAVVSFKYRAEGVCVRCIKN